MLQFPIGHNNQRQLEPSKQWALRRLVMGYMRSWLASTQKQRAAQRPITAARAQQE